MLGINRTVAQARFLSQLKPPVQLPLNILKKLDLATKGREEAQRMHEYPIRKLKEAWILLKPETSTQVTKQNGDQSSTFPDKNHLTPPSHLSPTSGPSAPVLRVSTPAMNPLRTFLYDTLIADWVSWPFTSSDILYDHKLFEYIIPCPVLFEDLPEWHIPIPECLRSIHVDEAFQKSFTKGLLSHFKVILRCGLLDGRFATIHVSWPARHILKKAVKWEGIRMNLERLRAFAWALKWLRHCEAQGKLVDVTKDLRDFWNGWSDGDMSDDSSAFKHWMAWDKAQFEKCRIERAREHAWDCGCDYCTSGMRDGDFMWHSRKLIAFWIEVIYENVKDVGGVRRLPERCLRKVPKGFEKFFEPDCHNGSPRNDQAASFSCR